MRIIILLALFTTSAAAQQWQPPRSLLVSRPERQVAAAKRLHLPANCLILLATLDCSDCKRPLEALRGNKSAVILIRSRPANVEQWKKRKPTAARVIAIDGEADDENWFGLGAFAMPTVIKWENGRAVGVSEHAPEN